MALTKRFCERERTPGKYRHMKRLYFEIKPTGTKSWTYRYRINGKDRNYGIGPYPTIGIEKATNEAVRLSELVSEGIDPLAPASPVRPVPTFMDAANEYIESHRRKWRSDKTLVSWRGTVSNHTDLINDKPVDQISVQDCLDVLQPLWFDHPNTALKIRGRMEMVWSAAMVDYDHNLLNPARWKDNLAHKLPPISRKKNLKPFRAISWQQLPNLIQDVKAQRGDGARALLWTIMTVSRSRPVRLMTWEQIDVDRKVWTIPAENMKAEQVHVVPLTKGMIEFLGQPKRPKQHVFVNYQKRPLSEGAMLAVLKRNGWHQKTVVHGMRSVFGAWAEENTNASRMVLRRGLAHTESLIEETYFRSDLLKKRRRVMKKWVKFLRVFEDA